jgi:hypothetical protein
MADWQVGGGASVKRRGILAAGAIVAGIAAKQTSQAVAATHQPEDLGLTLTNTATDATRLQYTGGVLRRSSILIVGDGAHEPGDSHAALAGCALGRTNLGTNGTVTIGVFGASTGSTADAAGVRGQHIFNGMGVYGTAGHDGAGTFGECKGTSDSTGALGSPIRERGCSGRRPSRSRHRCRRQRIRIGRRQWQWRLRLRPTRRCHAGDGRRLRRLHRLLRRGVIGRTTAAGYSGITGITTTPGAAAFAGASTVAGAYAAYFVGSVVVQGDFAVVGGAKNAAVKDAAGQHRLVCCMESPESWFEDFGTGQLVNGKGDVTLDPVFAQIARTDDC